MTIRDRGIMKYQPVLMAPELAQSLRRIIEEQDYLPEPILDEQQLETHNQVVCESMEHNLTVSITYYSMHKYIVIIGNIHYFQEPSKTIRLLDNFGKRHDLLIKHIVDIRIYEDI